MKPNTTLQNILTHFFENPKKVQVSILGEGNINDTFLVRSSEQTLVLQRINSSVFPRPDHLIHNLQLVSQHLLSQGRQKGQRWEDMLLIPTLSGESSVRDDDNNLWRALSYICNSSSVTTAQTTLQAKQTGWALGRFHRKLTGLKIQTLENPLPGFHHLSSYLHTYDTLKETSPTIKGAQCCADSIKKYRNAALSLERAIDKGRISKTITHGDPKIGNILFDQESGNAVSIIDLDTVGPGFFQHDMGDCIRSVCNNAGEEASTEQVGFDLSLCEAVLEGYFQEARGLLSTNDLEYIFDGIQAITFELGLRFFTDYLQGNIYFKVSNPEENLHKALGQFTLFKNISKKESQIRSLSYRKNIESALIR